MESCFNSRIVMIDTKCSNTHTDAALSMLYRQGILQSVFKVFVFERRCMRGIKCWRACAPIRVQLYPRASPRVASAKLNLKHNTLSPKCNYVQEYSRRNTHRLNSDRWPAGCKHLRSTSFLFFTEGIRSLLILCSV